MEASYKENVKLKYKVRHINRTGVARSYDDNRLVRAMSVPDANKLMQKHPNDCGLGITKMSLE